MKTYNPPINLQMFCQSLLSEEVKGNKLEAERRTGVSRQLFYDHFKKYAEFRKWYSDQCSIFLGLNEALPSMMLMKKILEGDVSAIRTYYELVGKIKNQNISVAGSEIKQIVQVYLPAVEEKKEIPRKMEQNGLHKNGTNGTGLATPPRPTNRISPKLGV